MKKEIVISETNDLAVVFEDGRAAEFVIRSGEQLVGDIILGKVESVVPAIEAAFVNIGHEKNGFIHVADLPIPQRGKKNKPPQIKSGDKLIVQIAKAPTGTKGARLTGRISVPGRYLVFVPHDNRVCISRRITDSKERERLRRIAFTLKDPGHGLIVRTEAIGASEEELRRDIDDLIERWAEILHEAQVRHSPALLYRDQDLLTRVLRDWLTADTERLVLEDREAFEKSTEILSDWMPDMVKNLHLHRGKDGVMQHYKVHAELEAALKPTIRLPSGGSIVIEPTEALTVIDVNSGKLTQSKSLQDTVLRTNLEAATEIARQLRLRDIGGVIIIDFISMDHASDRKKVINHLEDALKPDKSRPQITSQFSEHGLLEVARRRQGQSLTEQLTKSCPSCHGYGRVRNEVYSAAPVPAALELAPPDEPEAIVEDLIEEPMAGPDMRDSEPEPGVAAARVPQRGRGRLPAVSRVPGAPVAPMGLPVGGDFEEDVEDLGPAETGGADEGEDGGRRRRRRRRRGRGRGGERVAEAAPLMTAVGVPSDEYEPEAADEYDEEAEDVELGEPGAGFGGGTEEGEEERQARRRRRRRRGGRGRRGEGAEGLPTSPLEPVAAMAPQAGAARGFARPPGREPREPREFGESREPRFAEPREPREYGTERGFRDREPREAREFGGERDRGFREGREPREPRFGEGRDRGFGEGRDRGFGEGRDRGFGEGRDRGFGEGRDRGPREGREPREAREPREYREARAFGEPAYAEREEREPAPVRDFEERPEGEEREPREQGRFGRDRGERGGRDRGGRDRGGRDRGRGGFRDRGPREYGDVEPRPAFGEPTEGGAETAAVATQVAAAPVRESAPAAAASTAPKKLPKGITPNRPIVGPVQKTAPYQPKIASARPRMEMREVAPGVMQLVPVEDTQPAAEAPAKAAPKATKATASKAKAAAAPEATEGETAAAPKKTATKTTAARKKAEPKAEAAPVAEAEAPEEAEAKKPAARKRTTGTATKAAASSATATKAKTTTSRAKKPAKTE